MLSCSPRDAIEQAGVVLVDLDGCMIASGKPLPGAKDLIEVAGSRFFLVTNNSSHSALELSEWLNSIGLAISRSRILTAGEETLNYVLDEYGQVPIMLLASQSIHNRAISIGLRVDEFHPSCVVLMRDTDLTYAKLSLAIKHLSNGVPLIVSNPDMSHPEADGRPVPETGSLLSLFQAVLPHIRAKVIGKPNPRIFRRAVIEFGADVHQTVIIGDNPDTDGKGAETLGSKFFLVGRHRDSRFETLKELLKE